jgi:hypothetical protein
MLYIASVLSAEKYLNSRYAAEIEDIYMGDTQALFEGSIGLKDAINTNIDLYLKSKALISWGVKPTITVTTKGGMILYPADFDKNEDLLEVPDPLQVAADNFKVLNEGVNVSVDLVLPHNTPLTNVLLAFYLAGFVALLHFYHRAGIARALQEDSEKSLEIKRLRELKEMHLENLKALEKDCKKLTIEMGTLKRQLENEKKKASKTEDEMIAEIISLEEKIEQNLAFQSVQQNELEALSQKMKHLEKAGGKGGAQRPKAYDTVARRFKTIYKNIIFDDRALNGFMNLIPDMQIKCEEVIHQLNENPGLVPIKRKVFGMKGGKTIFEVIFGYKGRLYYRVTKNNLIDVLLIGTKNKQAKDLEYLKKIRI